LNDAGGGERVSADRGPGAASVEAAGTAEDVAGGAEFVSGAAEDAAGAAEDAGSCDTAGKAETNNKKNESEPTWRIRIIKNLLGKVMPTER
jgi:hypothetical protein